LENKEKRRSQQQYAVVAWLVLPLAYALSEIRVIEGENRAAPQTLFQLAEEHNSPVFCQLLALLLSAVSCVLTIATRKWHCFPLAASCKSLLAAIRYEMGITPFQLSRGPGGAI
jgi:hypothetical protein